MFAVPHLYSDVGAAHWHSHLSLPTSVAGLQHYHRQRVLRPRTNRSKCFAVGTGTPMCSPNISPLLRRAIWCKTDGDNLDSWAEWVDEWSNWTHFADSAHGKCAKMGARTGNLIGLQIDIYLAALQLNNGGLECLLTLLQVNFARAILEFVLCFLKSKLVCWELVAFYL